MSLDLFKQNSDVEVQEAVDSIGKFTFDSGAYDMKIKMAYMDMSQPNEETGAKGGAHNVNLILVDAKGKEFKYTEYVTSGIAKGQVPYYEKDGKKFPLPGWSKMNDMCLRATGKPLAEQKDEEKKIKVYDKAAQAEVAQPRQVLMSLIGKEVGVCIVETLEAHYKNAGETQSKNIVDKWYDVKTRCTTAEVDAGLEAGKWVDEKWLPKNKDQVRDLRSAKDKAATKSAGSAGAGVSNDTPDELFPD